MLTVVTPATNRRLTTVARAQALLGFGSSDGAKVHILIDQASEAIVRHCGREFARVAVRETFNVSASGLRLARSPLVEITSLTMNGSFLGSESYAVEDGVLFRSPLSVWRHYPSAWGLTIVEYVAGYVMPDDPGADLPADIERAAILTVGSYLSSSSRDPALRSESVEGVGSSSWQMPVAIDGLPSAEAVALLAPYRALGFA